MHSPPSRSAVILLLWLSSALLAGCSSAPLFGPGTREPPYGWGIDNQSMLDLNVYTKVTYTSGGHIIEANGGGLAHGTSSTAYGGLDPIPDAVHVHWVENNTDDVHDADVAVHGHIPGGEATFCGVLWLVITDGGVRLEVERRDNGLIAGQTARLRTDGTPATRPAYDLTTRPARNSTRYWRPGDTGLNQFLPRRPTGAGKTREKGTREKGALTIDAVLGPRGRPPTAETC